MTERKYNTGRNKYSFPSYIRGMGLIYLGQKETTRLCFWESKESPYFIQQAPLRVCDCWRYYCNGQHFFRNSLIIASSHIFKKPFFHVSRGKASVSSKSQDKFVTLGGRTENFFTPIL